MSGDHILEAVWALPSDATLIERLLAWRPATIQGKCHRQTMIRALCTMAHRPLPW